MLFPTQWHKSKHRNQAFIPLMQFLLQATRAGLLLLATRVGSLLSAIQVLLLLPVTRVALPALLVQCLRCISVYLIIQNLLPIGIPFLTACLKYATAKTLRVY